MVRDPKFKEGDLIYFPDNGFSSVKDYGIVLNIISDKALVFDCPFVYEIYWIVEGHTTIEENWWIEENVMLKARA